ncbi:sperm-associated microtubule inner protein 4 isoform X2 [Macrotis lagotis]|uniref:sperm-associated microtubule inner protein 4 isoform X2 n=1 Tax=Macrotis lagotis TaxID=92651 RepID=UPI003D68C11B
MKLGQAQAITGFPSPQCSMNLTDRKSKLQPARDGQRPECDYLKDRRLPKPLNIAAQPLNMEFPVGHPYQTHISRFAMFPTFTSPKDVTWGLTGSPQQPFPTTTFTRNQDRHILKKPKGKAYQDENLRSPPGSPKKALHRPGQSIYYNLSRCIHRNTELFYPKYPKLSTPNTTLTTSDPLISLKRANIQKNLERSHWITSYSRDFTGSGSMNPLELDDLHAKKVAILTGKIGFDPPPQARSHPEFIPSRPLKGRMARSLQGRRPRASIIIERRIPMCPDCTPQVLCTVHSLVPSHTEMKLIKGSTPAGPVLCKSQISEIEEMIRYGVMPPSPYDFPPPSKTEEEEEKEKEDMDDFYKIYEPPPFPKITDTYRNDALYWRQLLIRPTPKKSVETEDFLCYDDMKPSRLDQYIVWQNSISLSKPSILPALTIQKPPFNPKHWYINQSQAPPQIPDAESQGEKNPLLKWIPNAGVPRPRARLMDLQDSFSKSDAHRRFHLSLKEDGKDFQSNEHLEGK